jgi:hypothetical protein
VALRPLKLIIMLYDEKHKYYGTCIKQRESLCIILCRVMFAYSVLDSIGIFFRICFYIYIYRNAG